jgi:hypothetical protein
MTQPKLSVVGALLIPFGHPFQVITSLRVYHQVSA